MAGMRRCSTQIILVLTAIVSTGCNLLPHELQPHRMWRWNRQPPPSNDAYFSVDDRPPVETMAADLETELGEPVVSLGEEAEFGDADALAVTDEFDAATSNDFETPHTDGYGHTTDY